ncbi:terpene synthase 1 [Cinnamomum micranthum f. kanehirae]|uniref:Terpene synthase 1 n=1 Tax=Cinnamomum micranthum f. kanehirae TaxID=337451 RepID=A0A443PRV0_9MAGN|nr:terpene synthase 1 [Cinnamomum micranthum f. kanehirae]
MPYFLYIYGVHDHLLMQKPNAQTQQRANELKEDVRKMLRNVDDHLQELNLIDSIQRLGVAYHFEEEIAQALLRMYKSGRDYGDDLHVVALQFRLLRQEGYNVSPDVFMKFKDEEGKFKRTLAGDIRSLLSLFEAVHMGTHGENILDEAIAFTREHLKSTLPHLNPPFSTLVELALELPLRKRIERLQTSYYISVYQEDKDRSDILLEWWKSWDFAAKLPFIRDRVVECYFWILGVYFEPQYSRARKMLTKIISWDRSVINQFPDYIKLHFSALLDTVDKFEEELAQEGKSYRIPYLKQVFKEVSKGYLIEEQWSNSGYVPTLEEYMTNALITSAYRMLSVVSYVGMGDVATKEAFDWGVSMPKLIEAASLEQERGHVASIIQIYMNENGSTYEEACEKFKRMAAEAWKDINKECQKPTPTPMPLLMRTVNLTRVIEVLYQHRDGYTNPTYETKERILSVLVNPIPV